MSIQGETVLGCHCVSRYNPWRQREERRETQEADDKQSSVVEQSLAYHKPVCSIGLSNGLT